GSCFRIVHTELIVTWATSTVAGKSEEHKSSETFEELPKTIIIRHLKGGYEYENKIYTEVVNHGLGCRIVSDMFSEWQFANPNTVPCVVIHKGVKLNNERLEHHIKTVWQVLLIDSKAAEQVHTMMIGLRYRMHTVNLENIRWSQNLLQQLT
ncbi:hypothetical protein MAR_002863, partial [Mya arenaria]